MNDLIERQAAIDALCDMRCGCKPEECALTLEEDGTEECADVRFLMSIPSADVPDRKVGKWETYHRYVNTNQKHTGVDDNGDTHTITEHIYMEYDWLRCPFCKAQASSYFQDYCPHCGARMEDNNA